MSIVLSRSAAELQNLHSADGEEQGSSEHEQKQKFSALVKQGAKQDGDIIKKNKLPITTLN